jgi:hypothetical protein
VKSQAFTVWAVFNKSRCISFTYVVELAVIILIWNWICIIKQCSLKKLKTKILTNNVYIIIAWILNYVDEQTYACTSIRDFYGKNLISQCYERREHFVFSLPDETVDDVTVTQRALLWWRSPNVVSGSWNDFSVTVVLLESSAPFKMQKSFILPKKNKGTSMTKHCKRNKYLSNKPWKPIDF